MAEAGDDARRGARPVHPHGNAAPARCGHVDPRPDHPPPRPIVPTRSTWPAVRSVGGTPTPTYEVLRDVSDIHVVPVDLGPELQRTQPARQVARPRGHAAGRRSLARLVLLVRRRGIEVIHTSDRPRDAFARRDHRPAHRRRVDRPRARRRTTPAGWGGCCAGRSTSRRADRRVVVRRRLVGGGRPRRRTGPRRAERDRRRRVAARRRPRGRSARSWTSPTTSRSSSSSADCSRRRGRRI